MSPILTEPNVEGHGRNILAADEALGSSSLDPEQVGRHRLDVVAVVADDPGQAGLLQLAQLLRFERCRVFEPEPE